MRPPQQDSPNNDIVVDGQPGIWAAARPSTRPSDAPRFNTFEFHRVYSGAIAQIASGSTTAPGMGRTAGFAREHKSDFIIGG